MNILVHYHEIALKGRNRPFFIDRLAGNLRLAFSDVAGSKVHVLAGRLAVELPEGTPWDLAQSRLSRVYGIANYARSRRTAPDLEALKASVLASLTGETFSSFRVTTKRSYKLFPKNSGEIDRELGAAIHVSTGVKVDLENPDRTVFVEVLRDRILHTAEKIPGPGGFPVGSSGRVGVLLSGGIDSPVAAARLLKRGCKAVLVHFHSFPLLDRTTIDKAKQLAAVLTRFQFSTRLVLVPFGPVQQTIVASCPAPLRVVLYRRFMVRIAFALQPRYRYKALVTGESLGQVASQTLDNMSVIDEAAAGPILRPLVGMDKEEIVREARTLGTFDISTLPDQDCCQLFVPRNPATAAKLDEVLRAEAALDVPGLVGQAVQGIEEEKYRFPGP